MILLFSLLLLILALLVFLLVTPLSLRIDTWRQQYYVQVRGLVRCQLVWKEGPLLEMRVPFYRFSIDPLKLAAKKKKPERKKEKCQTRKGSSTLSFHKVMRILKSFRVREFRLDIDTADVMWNARLYPLFFYLNSNRRHTQINYRGENGLVLHLEIRAIRVLRAFVF